MPYFGVDPDRYAGWSKEEREEELENAGLPEKSLLSIDEYREMEDVLSMPDFRRVMAVIARRDEMMPVSDIAASVGVGRDEIEAAVESLVRVGLLRRSRGPDGEFFRASNMGRVAVEEGVEALVEEEWNIVD